MSAAKVRLPPIEQGATYRLGLYLLNPDKVTPINMNQCTARMQIKKTLADTVPLIELSTSNGRITIDVTTGKIQLLIAASDTILLQDTKNAVFDLELSIPPNTIARILEGKINIKGEVTQ